MIDKPEALRLSKVLRDMCENGAPIGDLWTTDQPDGDPFVMRAAELLESLHAECERLRADAERLDWLNENPEKLSRSTGYRGSASTWTVRDCDGVAHDFMSVRKAIDAARKEQA